MRAFFATLGLIWSLSALAVPGPMPHPPRPPHPHPYPQPEPQACTCYARMTDCYGRPLYTYWGRWTDRQTACGIALNLCLRDASLGYGGYGAKCFVFGK